jgi:hypothetical protein
VLSHFHDIFEMSCNSRAQIQLQLFLAYYLALRMLHSLLITNNWLVGLRHILISTHHIVSEIILHLSIIHHICIVHHRSLVDVSRIMHLACVTSSISHDSSIIKVSQRLILILTVVLAILVICLVALIVVVSLVKSTFIIILITTILVVLLLLIVIVIIWILNWCLFLFICKTI